MSKFHELQSRTINGIEQLQDFQVFTGHSYDRYGKMVASGHIIESITNVRTGTILKEKDLANILLEYLDNDLPRVVVYQLVSYFDAFFDDFLKEVGLILKKNKKPSVSERFAFLRKQITIKDITSDDEDRLIELIATRNVIAHGSGIVDVGYLRKAKSHARAQLGERLPLSRPYVYESADFLKQLVSTLTKAVIEPHQEKSV